MSEVYVLVMNYWIFVMDGMVVGWWNFCVEFYGNLYVLDCWDGCKLWMYDWDIDVWS